MLPHSSEAILGGLSFSPGTGGTKMNLRHCTKVDQLAAIKVTTCLGTTMLCHCHHTLTAWSLLLLAPRARTSRRFSGSCFPKQTFLSHLATAQGGNSTWEGSYLAVGVEATAAAFQHRCWSHLTSFAARAACSSSLSQQPLLSRTQLSSTCGKSSLIWKAE